MVNAELNCDPSIPSLVPVQCDKYCEFLAVLSLPSLSLALTAMSRWSRWSAAFLPGELPDTPEKKAIV